MGHSTTRLRDRLRACRARLVIVTILAAWPAVGAGGGAHRSRPGRPCPRRRHHPCDPDRDDRPVRSMAARAGLTSQPAPRPVHPHRSSRNQAALTRPAVPPGRELSSGRADTPGLRRPSGVFGCYGGCRLHHTPAERPHGFDEFVDSQCALFSADGVPVRKLHVAHPPWRYHAASLLLPARIVQWHRLMQSAATASRRSLDASGLRRFRRVSLCPSDVSSARGYGRPVVAFRIHLFHSARVERGSVVWRASLLRPRSCVGTSVAMVPSTNRSVFFLLRSPLSCRIEPRREYLYETRRILVSLHPTR